MSKKYIILILIFVLGFILRFWYINGIPPGLNRDEASIGYTAYSLSKTGRDEYGKSWPVSFKSFGDWKLPLYIYMDIIPIKLLGLTDTAVRLPSILLSSLTVIVTFFLAQQLLKNNLVSAVASLFFAISPWSIHLARNASESTCAIFFTSLGLLLYMKIKRNIFYPIIGTSLIALPLFTYHGNHIFTLFLFLGLTALFFKENKHLLRFWFSIAVFAVLASVIYSQTLFGADKTKISGLFITGDTSMVYEKVVIDRLQHYPLSKYIVNLIHNKYVFAITYSIQNYLKGFSPEFLFITGGGNTQHNIPDFGNLYLWMAPFLVLGISYLLYSNAENKYLILFWLFIAPLVPSITKDAPHTNRMASIMPLIEILCAYGFWQTLRLLSQKRKVIYVSVLTVLLFLFITNMIFWTDRYFIHFPQKRAAIWGEGYTKLISYLTVNKNFGVKEVVMSRPEYSPYIYFLFYNRTDPLYYRETVVRYPETAEGFQHVAKFGNYSFRQIDWADDLSVPDQLYIDWTQSVPTSATNSAVLVTKEVMEKLAKNNKDISGLKIGDIVISQKTADIKLQNSESMFTLIKTSKLQ